MVSTAFNNPQIPVPSQALLFENKKTEVKAEINCLAIGTIVSLNTVDQTVTVSINYLRQIFGGAGTSTADDVNNSTQAYPQLIKCPLMILTGGTSYLTFPVAKGDTCLVFFNDRDMDNWWSTGGTSSPPNSARVHDLNDGIVFVGIRSMVNSLSSYNMSGPQLTNGLAFVSVEDKIRLSVNLVTLRQGLDALFSALLAFVDSAGNTLSAPTAAAITAAQVLVDEVLK